MRYVHTGTRHIPVQRWALVFTSAVLLLGNSVALAQPPGGRMRTPRYDPTTVVSISGEITAVDKASGRAGLTGIHLDVKTPAGVEYAHLGPEAFVTEKGVTLVPGDKIEIVGSKVSIAGTPVVLVRELKKGTTSVALRDSAGYPLWAGQGLRRRVP